MAVCRSGIHEIPSLSLLGIGVGLSVGWRYALVGAIGGFLGGLLSWISWKRSGEHAADDLELEDDAL